jgi:hypothetical protein
MSRLTSRALYTVNSVITAKKYLLYYWETNSLFRCFLNDVSDGDEVKCGGKLFPTRVDVAGKARPQMIQMVGRQTSDDEVSYRCGSQTFDVRHAMKFAGKVMGRRDSQTTVYKYGQSVVDPLGKRNQ